MTTTTEAPPTPTATPAAALTAPARPSRGRVMMILAIIVVAILAAGGLTTWAINAQAQAAVAEQTAANAAAADQHTADRYASALATVQLRGQVIIDDAATLTASGSSLITPTELATLEGTTAGLAPMLELVPEVGSSGAEVKALYESVLRMVDGAYVRFGTVTTAAVAAGQAALDAGTSADAVTRQALVDALTALEVALRNEDSVVVAFAALDEAIAAVAASHAAAVAQAAAAAAAAASGASTYSYGGQTYYTNTGGTGGGGGGSGGTGGGGSPPPTYTDAQARADVENAYGAVPKGGDCDTLNYGTWSTGSTPPPPLLSRVHEGGWLAYTAWSIGNGGEVHYFACY